jgi:hypothetical protein
MIAYGILAIIILYLLNSILTSSPKKSPGASTGSWTVYGTNGCGWTRKQLEVMDSKKIPHTFVDCDKEDCKGAEAFPTLVDSAGNKSVGFKDF